VAAVTRPLLSPEPELAFDGSTYEPDRDHARLKGQLGRVYILMLDGRWRTLGEIAAAVAGSEAAVSARLRDLRKAKYGSHLIERRHHHRGLHSYRLVLP
jgi:hypothetical protein